MPGVAVDVAAAVSLERVSCLALEVKSCITGHRAPLSVGFDASQTCRALCLLPTERSKEENGKQHTPPPPVWSC